MSYFFYNSASNPFKIEFKINTCANVDLLSSRHTCGFFFFNHNFDLELQIS